jgi:hypothetical protein
VYNSTSPSYPIYTISPNTDTFKLTVVHDHLLLRLDALTLKCLEKRTLSRIDSTKLDRLPVISPDGRLLAVCDGNTVHIKDLTQIPLRNPDETSIEAAQVMMANRCYQGCYVVDGGEQEWLAQMHNDGTFEDVAQLGGSSGRSYTVQFISNYECLSDSVRL